MIFQCMIMTLFLAAIAALYVTMSGGLSVCRSVSNEFQRVLNALKVLGRLMFHCIKQYRICLVHIVHNAYKIHYALCIVYIENQMHMTVT
jgi:hypothetical protein